MQCQWAGKGKAGEGEEGDDGELHYALNMKMWVGKREGSRLPDRRKVEDERDEGTDERRVRMWA